MLFTKLQTPYSAIHKAAGLMVPGHSMMAVTALFTKPLARHSPGRNDPQGPFQLLAPFMAYGSFKNCTRQNHGSAGNHEASGFVNSDVSYQLFPAEWVVKNATSRNYPQTPFPYSWLHRFSGIVPVKSWNSQKL